ncbi:non-ribosomal peptide synthetase, partial [Massilia phyllosphaerae]|uniref:non-ribosomal peptide synthetase n=1 Tax=Massilia phyllosphaerae TaxID=3106034 RepID=UPI002B1CC375
TDDLALAIRETARREGVTPATLFHLAWAQVLAQCCGSDNVVFGTVLSGRLQGTDGAGEVIGMFINTLPLHLRLSGISVKEAVRSTNARLTELLTHEQASLALAQRCSSVPPTLPLFTTMLNYRHSHAASADEPVDSQRAWDGIRHVRGEERTNYPLGVSVDDLGDGFAISTQCVKAIDPSRINAYLNRAMESLIAALRDVPEKEVRSLDILPETERHQLLVQFNDTAAAYPQDHLIHQLFEQQAALQPEATAVVYEQDSLTYAELNRRANQVAHRLLSLGVKPDDRVAICVERSLEMVVGLLGILKAGAAYVPLDPAYPHERLAYMLADCAPTLLLSQTAVQERLPQRSMATLLLDEHEATFGHYPDSNPVRGALTPTENNLAYVIYTSGSTGVPKGAGVFHRGLRNLLFWYGSEFAFGAADKVLVVTSFSFDLTQKNLFVCLLAGGQLHLGAPLFDPEQIVEQIARERIDTLNMTPSAFYAIAESVNAATRCTSLRRVFLGGEPIQYGRVAELLERCPQLELVNSYGPTECSDVVSYHRLEREGRNYRKELIPIGRPIFNTHIYVLNPHGMPVPVGVAGEIHIGGIGVGFGYLNRGELTAERFIPDPFSAVTGARMYRTGDLGRYLADGNIEYLGRNDFQVKIRGFRIELGEIEARLATCDGVREAIVIAREDQPGDKRLVAYVVPQPGREISTAILRAELATTLADYMLPGA